MWSRATAYRLAVVAVGVGVAAAGLGEAAADHVADRQDRDVEPRLLGAEATGVGLVDDLGGDQDAGQDGEEGEELGRLERRLGLRLATGSGTVGLVQAVAVVGARARGAGSGAHGSSYADGIRMNLVRLHRDSETVPNRCSARGGRGRKPAQTV